jgi:hypothetical protein
MEGPKRGASTPLALVVSRADPRRRTPSTIPEVWHMAQWPSSRLGTRTWLDIFKGAVLVTDCSALPPTEPMTVFRGSDDGHKRGFSWALDVRQAAWFADRPRPANLPRVNIYSLTVPPEAVLAHIYGRSEDEIVVNPYRLRGAATPQLVKDAPRFETLWGLRSTACEHPVTSEPSASCSPPESSCSQRRAAEI